MQNLNNKIDFPGLCFSLSPLVLSLAANTHTFKIRPDVDRTYVDDVDQYFGSWSPQCDDLTIGGEAPFFCDNRNGLELSKFKCNFPLRTLHSTRSFVNR